MDPQQCLAIEVTHSALENAGFTKKNMKGTKTGVYIGTNIINITDCFLQNNSHLCNVRHAFLWYFSNVVLLLSLPWRNFHSL